MAAPIILDPLDYWQLRAYSADLDREQTALALVQTRLDTLRTRRAACWAALVEKYHLDVSTSYAARDAECSLTADGFLPGTVVGTPDP